LLPCLIHPQTIKDYKDTTIYDHFDPDLHISNSSMLRTGLANRHGALYNVGMKRQIPYHGCCFVCGNDNPHSIGLTWFLDDDKTLSAEFTFTEAQQGPPGHAHGGASAAVLDEAMGLVVWAAGYKVAAVNIEINYHKPVPLNQVVTLDARITQMDERKIFSAGEIKLADSTVAVSGSGIYVVAPQLFEKVRIPGTG
jgi:uncharacterized protein (TIGR00369 family)